MIIIETENIIQGEGYTYFYVDQGQSLMKMCNRTQNLTLLFTKWQKYPSTVRVTTS